MLDFAPETVERLFADFRGAPDVFGPFKPERFGTINSDAERDEVAALLYAIRTTGERFRMVSLGAAPGEWPVRAERAYKRVHPHGDFRAYSFEGDAGHCAMTYAFVEENGASPDRHEIRHAAAAGKDGVATFPIINPELDWGAGIAAVAETEDALGEAAPMMTERQKQDRIGANGGRPLEYQTIPAVSLSTMAREFGPIDVLHSDIQGGEIDVFRDGLRAGLPIRMCIVATHGKRIESGLEEAFAAHGWRLEIAHTCDTYEEGDEERVRADGMFVWTNPLLFTTGSAPFASPAM